MAHKSLIGGTVYEKKGGADLINGTVYQKNYGKTLIDGTVYEVGFVKMVTVTITGSGSNNCSVTIEGTTYTSTTTLEVPAGTIIDCYTWFSYCSGCKSGNGAIYLNGSKVGTMGTSAYNTVYDYTVTTNVTIQLSSRSRSCDKDCSRQKDYSEEYIYITEQ